ncbi:hypothetical protein M0R45_017354 [Rubus argutus]|uniref:Uncharacterized protein n=1 Tax=Rubus argutus TaxID=59490 RepID=A0AAW1XXR8_RUBAR
MPETQDPLSSSLVVQRQLEFTPNSALDTRESTLAQADYESKTMTLVSRSMVVERRNIHCSALFHIEEDQTHPDVVVVAISKRIASYQNSERSQEWHGATTKTLVAHPIENTSSQPPSLSWSLLERKA